MLMVKFIFITFQYIIPAHSGFIQEKIEGKVLKVDRLDGHCKGRNFPFRGLFQGVKGETNSLAIANITMLIKEDLMDKIQGIVTITRCHSKENLNSCEDYSRLPNFNICQLMNPDGLFGQNILAASFTPKFKCPYKKGTYSAYNYSANLTPFMFFNPDGWYWKTQVELYSPEDNRLLGRLCFDACSVPKSHT